MGVEAALYNRIRTGRNLVGSEMGLGIHMEFLEMVDQNPIVLLTGDCLIWSSWNKERVCVFHSLGISRFLGICVLSATVTLVSIQPLLHSPFTFYTWL